MPLATSHHLVVAPEKGGMAERQCVRLLTDSRGESLAGVRSPLPPPSSMEGAAKWLATGPENQGKAMSLKGSIPSPSAIRQQR